MPKNLTEQQVSLSQGDIFAMFYINSYTHAYFCLLTADSLTSSVWTYTPNWWWL